MKKLITALVVALALAASASAQTIATWTFETSIPTTAGPFSPEVGAGIATAFHSNGATVYSNPAGNGSVESWSSNTWTTSDYYQFEVSTVSFTGITLTWDQTRSSTGPANFDLQWSTDGSSFSTIQSYVVGTTSWSSASPSITSTFTQSFAAVPAIDNDSSVYFRMLFTGTTPAASGTNRVDNVTVTAIPEPSTYAMIMGVVTLGLVILRRRQKA